MSERVEKIMKKYGFMDCAGNRDALNELEELVKDAVKDKVRKTPVRRALGAAYQDDLIMIDKAIKAIDEV